MFSICFFFMFTTKVLTSRTILMDQLNKNSYETPETDLRSKRLANQEIACCIFDSSFAVSHPKLKIRFQYENGFEIDYEKLIMFKYFSKRLKGSSFYIELDNCKSSAFKLLVRIKECNSTEPNEQFEIINLCFDTELIALYAFLDEIDVKTSKNRLFDAINKLMAKIPLNNQFILCLREYLKKLSNDCKPIFLSKLIHFKDIKFKFQDFYVKISSMKTSPGLASEMYSYIPAFSIQIRALVEKPTKKIVERFNFVWDCVLEKIIKQHQHLVTTIFILYANVNSQYDENISKELVGSLKPSQGQDLVFNVLKGSLLHRTFLEFNLTQSVNLMFKDGEIDSSIEVMDA